MSEPESTEMPAQKGGTWPARLIHTTRHFSPGSCNGILKMPLLPQCLHVHACWYATSTQLGSLTNIGVPQRQRIVDAIAQEADCNGER